MPATTAPPIIPKEIISLIGIVFVQRGKILRIDQIEGQGMEEKNIKNRQI